jgi:hypothetical protein
MNHVLINFIEEEFDICEEIADLTNTYMKVCEIIVSRKKWIVKRVEYNISFEK